MTPDLLPPRIAAKVKVDASGCWLWLASTSPNGYGQVSLNGRTTTAHRATYSLLGGPIPDGYHVDHLCRVRNCVNPDHLEPVTAAENQRRSRSAITHCPQGHAYDEGNTFVNRRGQRQCRECRRSYGRAYQQRLRDAAKAARSTSGGVKAAYDLPRQSVTHAITAAPPLGT